MKGRVPRVRAFPCLSCRYAFTLVEAVVFVAVGTLVIGAMIAFLWRGSGMLALAGRSSGVQEELRTFLEHLDADAGELVTLEKGQPFDTHDLPRGGSFRFVMRSARIEADVAAPAGPGWRLADYQVQPSLAAGLLEVVRHVSLLGPTGAIDSGTGIPSSQSMTVSLAHLRIAPLVAAAGVAGEPRYWLMAGADARAARSGTWAVGLAVDVTMGSGDSPAANAAPEPGVVTHLATVIWCRDRVIALGWGGGI